MSSNSEPGISFIAASTRTQWSFFTWPFSPENDLVSTENSRSAPSMCDDEVRSFNGQFGQVRSLFSFSGGFGITSSCSTDSAPWRTDVPMQSEPVSPPPITTTCFPSARIGRLSACGSLPTRRFCCGRNSMAK